MKLGNDILNLSPRFAYIDRDRWEAIATQQLCFESCVTLAWPQYYFLYKGESIDTPLTDRQT